MIYKGPRQFSFPSENRDSKFLKIMVNSYTMVDDGYGNELKTAIKHCSGVYAPKNGKVPKHKFVMEPSQNQKVIEITKMISSTCRLAENLNHDLLDYLRVYYFKRDEEMYETVLKLDFMKQRDVLSEIIKKDKSIHDLERLNSSSSRKMFRKLFCQFIEDRNIYTHGDIFYYHNENMVLIEYLSKGEEKEKYCIVDKEVIKSHMDLFNYLRNNLGIMRKHINNPYNKIDFN